MLAMFPGSATTSPTFAMEGPLLCNLPCPRTPSFLALACQGMSASERIVALRAAYPK